MTPSWLLSVDPGNHAAYALWELSDTETWSVRCYGRLEEGDAGDVFTLLAALEEDYDIDWPEAVLAVEGQWYDGGRRTGGQSTHYRAVERIVESRCAWSDAAVIAGAEAEVVPPGVWIRAVSKGAPGATPAERVSAVRRRVFPDLETTADEDAALMLGAWWLRQRGQRIARSDLPRERRAG